MTPLWLSLFACTAGGTDDTAEPCDDACLADLRLELSDSVPMAVRASWNAGTVGQCHVRYREVDGDWWTTPVQDCGPGDRGTVVLRGLHADTRVEVEAVLTVEGVEHPRQLGAITTNPLPEGVPTFTVDVPWSGEGDGDYVQGSFSQEQAGVFILDRDGRYVYLWMNEPDQRRDVFNARLTTDHSAFWLLLNQDRVATDWGLMVRRDWFGEVRRTIELPWIHHDLLPLPDDAVLVIEGDPDDPDQEIPIWGDRILRIDPDDTVTELWSSWDDLSPPARSPDSSTWFGDGVDWIHGNSLAWSEDRGTVLMGSPQLQGVFEVDAGGDGLLRTYGGLVPDAVPVDGPAFEHPHGAHWNPDDELMLLSTDWDTEQTRAVSYTVDEPVTALTPAWEHAAPDHYAHVGGNAVRHGDNTLLSYGSGLVLQELDPAGQVVWQVHAVDTKVIFQVHPVADLWDGSVE